MRSRTNRSREEVAEIGLRFCPAGREATQSNGMGQVVSADRHAANQHEPYRRSSTVAVTYPREIRRRGEIV
ncbi:hypothetical protein BD413DRAFT_267619 [Trametes elegans]|nr:hypothetical protein BD413DRAFT_267619 [Trametes elegans]